MRVVTMPGGEITPAAERGVIDCAEWVSGIEDLRFGFHTIWKYHDTPGMHETVTNIYRGMFDFMLLQVIGLAAVFFFPQAALWLPTVLFR